MFKLAPPPASKRCEGLSAEQTSCSTTESTMAMIEIDLGEFVNGLIARKSRARPVDEAQRAAERRELLMIADKAVDVAIMRAVFFGALDRTIGKRTMDKLHDLMQSGVKADTLKYLRRILPDWEEVIANELARFEKMYLEDRPR